MRNSATCIVASLEAYGQPLHPSSFTIKAVANDFMTATHSPSKRHECQRYAHKPACTSTHPHRRDTLSLRFND
jgi:hypothetical protein